MAIIEKEAPKNLSYYIRRRFIQNKPAVVGLCIIVFAILVAILGYLIMPDQTPDANDGDISIGKKKEGFTTQFIKFHRQVEVHQNNFLVKMLVGQDTEYEIKAISKYIVNGYDVEYHDSKNNKYHKHLLPIVKPLFVGKSTKLPEKEGFTGNFRVNGEEVTYLDPQENIQKTTRETLLKDFNEKNIETRTYALGTETAGRDMLSCLILGTRISLGIGFVSVIISLIIGLTLGSIAGYFGGWVDNLVMWVMTVVWSIPNIMLVITISVALQSRGIWVVFVAVGLTTWVEIARVVRGQIMEIRQKQYVEAARAMGVGHYGIIKRHILPNILGQIIVVASANFASAILTEAGLSFLGLGVEVPTPSWGMMIREGYKHIGIAGNNHLLLYPSVCISVMVLAFNLLGNGLRDAYDPKTLVK